MKTSICISLDVDWASDDVIDFVAQKFIQAKIKSTWFITHDSAAVSKLLAHPQLFECGIHPNFLPGSSHGDSPERILDSLLKIVPDAQIMRTHCLYQSTPLFRMITEKYPQIKADISLLLPDLKHVFAHKLYLVPERPELCITRIPFIWEDDVEMLSSDGNFVFEPLRFVGDGHKILNFHPIHVALNSHEFSTYMKLKETKQIASLTLKECLANKNTSVNGTEDFLDRLLKAGDQFQFVHIRDFLS